MVMTPKNQEGTYGVVVANITYLSEGIISHFEENMLLVVDLSMHNGRKSTTTASVGILEGKVYGSSNRKLYGG